MLLPSLPLRELGREERRRAKFEVGPNRTPVTLHRMRAVFPFSRRPFKEMEAWSVSLGSIWSVKASRRGISFSLDLEQVQQLLEASGISQWEICGATVPPVVDNPPDAPLLASGRAAKRFRVWPIPDTPPPLAPGEAPKPSDRVAAHQTGPGAQKATLRSFIAELSWVMLQRLAARPEDVVDAVVGAVDPPGGSTLRRVLHPEEVKIEFSEVSVCMWLLGHTPKPFSVRGG